ncbi:hypothetical protein KSS87_021149 [Heliosperma pusillum]|nr:hypothetical protein KSS87_021149 [Heliosperma pusillum]
MEEWARNPRGMAASTRHKGRKEKRELGEVRITTTRYATRIGLNKEIPKVEEYRTRNRDLPVSSNSRITELSNDYVDLIRLELIKTILEIVKSDKAGYCVPMATTTNLDLEGNLYYLSCKNYFKGAMIGEDGKQKCKDKCLGNNPTKIIPRFQTKFMVTDSNGSYAKVTMFESYISKEIKMTAIELLDHQNQSDDVPEELGVFIGREFVFKLGISHKWNLDRNSNSYTVANMTNTQNIIARWKNAYAKIIEDQLEVEFTTLQNNLCINRPG